MTALRLRLVFVVATLCAACAARADVKLPSLFADNLVLQQHKPVPVWGWAAPGETVSVEFAGQTKAATADIRGKWMVTLDPMPASAEPRAMTVSGSLDNRKSTVRNILVGEVWLCGGQSNMERQLGPRPPQPPLLNWQQEAAGADFPQIRHFGVLHKASLEPVNDVVGSWQVCSPATATNFTAVGFFFARELWKELNVPIGLVHSSWGGTQVIPWTSKTGLDSEPEVKQAADAQRDKPPEALRRKPTAVPSVLFQSMIAPLIPCAIEGVIWYQGESDAGNARLYRTSFPLMICDWRRAWGQGDFPFYFVQLPNFMKAQPEPAGRSGWAELREAQAGALALPATGMAITIDVGDPTNVHPPNKRAVGERLARLALAQTYGRAVESSGPLFASAAVEGGAIRVKFTHLGGGLVANGGGPLKQFAIAGPDRKFVWADAKIAGDSVVVSSASVPNPVAVRYAWADNPEGCNLGNRAGLPAAPFRTDTW